jgi:2,3-bisphosphoglycerate-dependent phosphoglycerate mutase
MGYLLLVRHGESRWNLDNKFTGWVDVPLSETGVREALLTAKRLEKLKLDMAFTSDLERAQETLLLILADQKYTGIFTHKDEHNELKYSFEATGKEIPIHASWKLNERHYGALQGKNKAETAKIYGAEKVLEWRRSFKATPPEGESLEDVYKRAVPYFKKEIMDEVAAGKNVIVVAHGNTLRAIVKYIDEISDEQIAKLELKMAEPLIYKFEGGKLEKAFVGYTFDRPILW